MGYYKLDDLNEKKYIIEQNVDKKKIWFATGDIGEYLPNGNFNIIGIIYFNIYILIKRSH